MRKLGDQWIEVIDGKMHMLKAVERPEEISHISARVHPCFKCLFQMDDYDCAYPDNTWKCDLAKNIIIKDLGILRNGKVPSSFGVYPTTSAPEDENETWCLYAWVAENGKIIKEEKAWGETEQEAIDAWNRRA